MSYFDEQIIKKLNQHKTETQGTIETGITICEELYLFERKELFDNRMSIMLPETFIDMPIEQAKLKYPMEQRPQVIKTNEAGDINFTFSLIEQQMNNNYVEELMRFFKKVLKTAQPSNVFHEEKVEQIGELTVGWFDYVSNGYDKKLYNIVYVLPVDGKLLHGVFNCALEDGANWRTVALQVIRSIKETKEQKYGI